MGTAGNPYYADFKVVKKISPRRLVILFNQNSKNNCQFNKFSLEKSCCDHQFGNSACSADWTCQRIISLCRDLSVHVLSRAYVILGRTITRMQYGRLLRLWWHPSQAWSLTFLDRSALALVFWNLCPCCVPFFSGDEAALPWTGRF